jgi:hypothetical protein
MFRGKDWPFSWIFSICEMILPKGMDVTISELVGIALVIAITYFALTKPYQMKIDVISDEDLREVLGAVEREKK